MNNATIVGNNDLSKSVLRLVGSVLSDDSRLGMALTSALNDVQNSIPDNDDTDGLKQHVAELKTRVGTHFDIEGEMFRFFSEERPSPA